MTDDPAVRIEALEALLVEKGLVDPELVDEVIEHYETSVGPLNGAKVVARAWAEPDYQRAPARRRHGRGRRDGLRRRRGPHAHRVGEHAGRPQRRRLHAVLVLPVARARAAAGLVQVVRVPLAHGRPAPRRARARWGSIPDDVRVRVWDSSAEARYFVLPERPRAPRGWAADELEPLVTRDAMIGVAQALAPDA